MMGGTQISKMESDTRSPSPPAAAPLYIYGQPTRLNQKLKKKTFIFSPLFFIIRFSLCLRNFPARRRQVRSEQTAFDFLCITFLITLTESQNLNFFCFFDHNSNKQ